MWEQKVKQSLKQVGDTDNYHLRTPLHIPDQKEITNEVLPILLNVIRQQNSQSGRPLQLILSQPTIMQVGMTSVLRAIGSLPRHSYPTWWNSLYVDVCGCRSKQSRGQRMPDAGSREVAKTSKHKLRLSIPDADNNRIGDTGCLHLSRAEWNQLQ